MNLNKYQRFIVSFLTALLVAFCTKCYVMVVESSLNITNFFFFFSLKHFILFAVISFIVFRILYDVRKTVWILYMYIAAMKIILYTIDRFKIKNYHFKINYLNNFKTCFLII